MANINELKTIEMEPAKIIFNHEEIEKDLEKNLRKYNGLTFTEDDAAECKRTIAELRKGKKAVDEYRKDIKKQLNAPVTEFEDKCKTLNKKFDDVINPLVKQSDAFETKRRNEKRERVQEIIAKLIEESDLLEKYATELVVQDEHLTKSRSMKSIEEELQFQTDNLKMKQDKEAADKEIVSNTVKLANAENGLSLPESSYINLVDYKDVESIKGQIEADAEKEVTKREAKKAAEEERLEKERRAKEAKQAKPEPKPVPPIEDIESVPEPVPFEVDPEQTLEYPPESEVFEIYKVTGTEQQISDLESFMTSQGLRWEVVDNE